MQVITPIPKLEVMETDSISSAVLYINNNFNVRVRRKIQ